MIVFQEHLNQADLHPFTLLRDTADLFCGAFTNRQRWEAAVEVFNLKDLPQIPSHQIPLFSFWERCQQNGVQEMLAEQKDLININRNLDFIQNNEQILKADIELLRKMHTFQSIPDHVLVTGSKNDIYIEEGATLENIIINTTAGPVYISKNALIMDGSCLRGPMYIGPNAVIKMGAAIYSGTSIANHVIAGGEIKNSIINAYSNKAHDGYLGDSIIGEWCNLGASTSVSNVKNTASEVMVWNMNRNQYEPAGKKAGTMMGDFSRTAINTSLNTGTVIGICANLVPVQKSIPKFVPSFTWLQEEMNLYAVDKAFKDIDNWMQFKGKKLNIELQEKLTTIFNKASL